MTHRVLQCSGAPWNLLFLLLTFRMGGNWETQYFVYKYYPHGSIGFTKALVRILNGGIYGLLLHFSFGKTYIDSQQNC